MSRLGPYTLEGRVSVGGATESLRARTGSGEQVFLRRLLPHVEGAPRAAWLAEAYAMKGFRHPHVVGVLDASGGDAPYVASEWVEGATDAQKLVARARRGLLLPEGAVARVLADAAAGLHACHEHRVSRWSGNVHGDLSPGALVIGADGVTRIAEFGVARAFAGGPTWPGVLRPKIGYLSPERARGEPFAETMDVFVLGAIGWELLTGLPWLPGESDFDRLHALLKWPERSVLASRPDVSVALDAAMSGATKRDPAERHPSAGVLAEALRPLAVDHDTVRALLAEVDTPVGR